MISAGHSTYGRRILLSIGSVLVASCLLAIVAVAARPTPDGKYSGTLQAGEKELQLHVSGDGKTATGVVLCSGEKSGTFPRFPIVNGAFKVTDKIGGTAVAAATGTILSADRIKVRLNLSPDSAICDGRGGTIFLKLNNG